MRDGIYKVQFQTPLGQGAGVVVLQGDKLRGGDSRIYYIGTYSQSGDQFTADVETDAHTQVPGMASVFGVDRAHINLTGRVTGDSAQVTGTAREAPNVSFQATLTRIGD
jgi:hypothetical protein